MSEDSDARAERPEVAAVAAVATEYFQSWFAGDGDRMRAVLHPARPSAPLNTRAAAI